MHSQLRLEHRASLMLGAAAVATAPAIQEIYITILVHCVHQRARLYGNGVEHPLRIHYFMYSPQPAQRASPPH